MIGIARDAGSRYNAPIAMEKIDRDLLMWALKRCSHNISHAAKMRDLPRSRLRSKMEKYGIAEEG